MLRYLCASFLGAVSLLCVYIATAQNPVFHDPSKPFKADVDILALRSSLLHGYAGGQQTYLAHVHIQGETRLALLIDRYQVADYPIRYSLLTSHQRLIMQLRRAEECDEPANYVLLPVGENNLFDSLLPKEIEQKGSERVACFVVDHQRTRAAR